MTTLRSNQDYLRSKQYPDASNLRARIALHERFSTNREDWQRWVFDQFDFPRRARLLELGCGPGSLWQGNLGRIPRGWKIILSDFSPGMLDEAWRTLHSSGNDFQFEVIDAQKIPYPNNYFDGVIANHMIYHVPNRPAALAEIHRVLTPGGKLYAATNGEKHMAEVDDIIRRFNPDMAEARLELGPNEFTLENGAEQLSTFFPKVDMRPFENALEVTEAAPLVAYVLSMVNPSLDFSADQIASLERLVAKEIGKKRSLHITKSTGLFIAEKSNGKNGNGS
ncbi:MAG: class I SAM-dependent methyltransferase [Anaerolineales bacterium]|nr:class I SAM-dependent methyltransferase [Anaerolineales bacterium]